MEVAGAGRTMGVTLKEMRSHRECAEEGYRRTQVFPSSLWLPSGEQILGGSGGRWKARKGSIVLVWMGDDFFFLLVF